MSKKIDKSNWPIVAICYDFDKTLSPTDMQNYSLIPSFGVSASEFWGEANELVKNNVDGILAGMYCMVEHAKKNNMKLTKKQFNDYGRDVELFNGLDTWFERINAYGEKIGVVVEHYIISAGIKEIIEGNRISKYFKSIFASSFYYDKNGVAVWPAHSINATTKTQFLSRISKGFLDLTDELSFHQAVDKKRLRIPYENIIYIGDSFTDVPAMRVVSREGGVSIGVYNPKLKEIPLNINLLKRDERISFYAPADYSPNSKMERLMKGILDVKKLQILSERQTDESNKRIENKIYKIISTEPLDKVTLSKIVSKDNIANIVFEYMNKQK